jgi:hypothetical protein
MASIDGDLSYKSALVVNLAKAAADIVQHVLQAQPPEQAAVLLPALLAGKTTVILSCCVSPFEIAVHAQATDPANTDPPLLLCEIKGGQLAGMDLSNA